MLRTENGHRVYDAGDIPALIALGDISELLLMAEKERASKVRAGYKSAAETHRLAFGHVLAFGCCRSREQDDDAA